MTRFSLNCFFSDGQSCPSRISWATRLFTCYHPTLSRTQKTHEVLKVAGDAEVHDFFLETPLHLAIGRGSVESVSSLTRDGKAVIDAAGKEGRTPLMWVAYYGNLPVMNLLCESGVDLDLYDCHGRTIVH